MKISYTPLWHTLVDKDMKRSELKKGAQLTQASLAKLNKGEHISLGNIAKICAFLNCKVEQVVKVVDE